MKTTDRARTRLTRVGVPLGSLAIFAVFGAPVTAQESPDQAWFPWFGCWETADTPGGEAGDASGLCVAPRDGQAGVELLTVTGDRVTATRALIADGERRPVEESGCSGWERASWSADEQRVFLRSELMCEGGTRRVTSGIIAMVSSDEWVDVQTIEAGSHPIVRTRRFGRAPETVAQAIGLEVPQEQDLAFATARAAAAQPLSVADLTEASQELSTEALEMFLFERRGSFDVDAQTLLAMADGGVPESVIDLVVALAYPDVFELNTDARMVGYRPAEPTAADLATAQRRGGRTVYGRLYSDPFAPFSYGYYNPYSYNRYGYSSYSPFGWGSSFGWRSTRGPVIIIDRPIVEENDRPSEDLRLVKGRGYTRGGGNDTGLTGRRATSRDRLGTSSTRRTSTSIRKIGRAHV